MGIFKSKEEKRQQKKMLVRQSMKELEKRIAKLTSQQQVYVKAAQVAIREDLPDQLELAKKGLQMTISERKRTYKMLLNAQIIEQMRDMTEMTTEFLGAVQTIAKEISGSTTADVRKISSELKMAMGKVEDQTENLQDMLDESQETVSDFSQQNSQTTDDELNQLIYGTSAPKANTESSGGVDIDNELADLQKKLGL